MNPMQQRLLNLQQAGMQSRGRVVTYNPRAVSAARQSPARAQGDGLDGLRAAAQANRATRPQGGGGFLGTVLNNPISQALMMPLRAMDVPRRLVLSGLQEGIDALGSGDASWSDFTGQVKDESFGFGTIIGDATGNKWVDRALGFAGDVLFDPMTYLTFGAGKFAGEAGRVAAATKLAEAGLDEAATKVGRLGAMAARGAEREALFAGMKNGDRLAQSGLRFAGMRIPGTERLAETVGTGLARGRAGVMDALPDVMRGLRTPVGLEDPYRVLRSGQGDTRSAIQAIAGVNAKNGGRDFFQGRWVNTADRVARETESDGRRIFKMLEGEIPMQGEAAASARKFFDDTFEDVSKVAPAVGRRENYVPHQFTDAYRKSVRELSDAGQPLVVDGVKIDLTRGEGASLRRNIGPGSKVELPDGRVIEIETGFASEINDKLGAALGGIKVVEDDVSKVLQRYVEDMGETVGRGEMLRRVEQIGTPGAGMADVVDKRATKAAREGTLGQAGRQAKRARSDAGFVARQMDQAAGRVRKDAVRAAQGRVGAAEGRLGDIAAQRAGLGENLVDLDVRAMRAQDRLAADTGAVDELLGGVVSGSEKLNAADGKKMFNSPKLSEARDARRTELDNAFDTVAELDAGVKSEFKREMDSIDAARSATKAKNAATEFNLKQAEKQAQRELDQAKKLLKRAKSVKRVGTQRGPNAFDQVGRDLEAVARDVGTYTGSETTRDLLSFYASGVARLTRDQESGRVAAATLKYARSKEFQPVLKSVVKDGFERIGTDLLGEADGVIVREQAARMLRNFEQAVSQKDFWRIVDTYTKFFKTYATATPGFHVRNGMSAAFMNATDGVAVNNMRKGVQLWGRFSRSPQAYFDALPTGVSADQAEQALRAVFMSGGGEGAFGRAEIRLGKNKLTNNTVTRFSQHVGGRVEGWARMGMALDSILAGETVEMAAARIKRIHFDYAEVSRMDRAAKRIIPFWTFMSRNVPLQMQQMILKPRMYQSYRALVRNMGEDYENDMVPKSWQEAGAFKIGGNTYMAPDLPFVRLQDELTKLTSDPQRLLADANPLLKVPLETLVAKRQFFQDRPFQENGLEAVDQELAPFGPILNALGLTETSGGGQQVVDERVGYALRNLFPLLGQYQRLVSNDPYYDERRAQSVAGYVGLPIKTLTSGQQEAEARRRYIRRNRRVGLSSRRCWSSALAANAGHVLGMIHKGVGVVQQFDRNTSGKQNRDSVLGYSGAIVNPIGFGVDRVGVLLSGGQNLPSDGGPGLDFLPKQGQFCASCGLYLRPRWGLGFGIGCLAELCVHYELAALRY